MAENQVYQQLKALEVNKTPTIVSVNASRSEIGNTLTGTTKTYSTLDAQGVESVNSVKEWSAANDNAKKYFQSVADGEASGSFATQKARVRNLIGNGFGLDSPVVDSSKTFQAFDLDEAVSAGYNKSYEFDTGTGNTTSASDLVFDKTLINSERSKTSSKGQAESIMAAVKSNNITDSVTQEKMKQDLASYSEAMQNDKLAYGSPKNNKSEIFDSKEIVSDAAPLTFEPLPSMQVSEEQISSYAETLETEKSKTNVESYKESQVELFTEVAKNNEEIRSNQAFEDAKKQAAENAEKLMHEMAQDTKKAEILASQEAERNQKIQDALINEREGKFQNQNGDYDGGLDHDVKQGPQGLQDSLSTIDEAENQAEKARQIQQKINDKHTRNKEEMGEPELWRDEIGRDYLTAQQQKENNDAQDKWTNNNQYVNIHGAAIQQEIAEFDKDDTLVDRHPVFNKTKAELAAEENLSAAELDRLKSNASTNTIGAGVVQREEEAELKAQALREQMATYDSSKYKSATSHLKSNKNKPEKSKIPDKYATFGDKRGNPDLLTGKDPFRFTTLTYPTEVTTSPEYGHYMLFYVNAQNKTKYKYHGYNDDGNYAVVGDVVESQRRVYEGAEAGGEGVDPDNTNLKYRTYYDYNTGANADEVAYQKQQSYSGVRGNVLQSNQVTLMRQRKATEGVASRVDLTSRITDSVALYLPSDVQSNVSASYTGFDMGLLGYLALGGADIIKQVKNRDFEGAARNFIGTGERMLTEMIKKAGITAVDAAFGGTGGTEQVFNKVFGQTTNPFIEVAFNNMTLRDFSYTFNFRPRSADETEEVKAIIQLFRFHMAPELKGTNHRYMTLPSTFDIHYMYQTDPETATENTFYNKIATCVLERCDVNYTPTGVKSFDDGAPTEISMALSFKETELLTKQKINDGF